MHEIISIILPVVADFRCFTLYVTLGNSRLHLEHFILQTLSLTGVQNNPNR